MRNLTIGLSVALLIQTALASEKTVIVRENNARGIVGSLITAGIKEKKTSLTGVYSYSVKGLLCKTSNHGGPENVGISFFAGCYKGSNMKVGDFGKSGARMRESEGLQNAIQAIADANSVTFYDCAMGKCFASLKKLVCTVDVGQELSTGCECALTFSDLLP